MRVILFLMLATCGHVLTPEEAAPQAPATSKYPPMPPPLPALPRVDKPFTWERLHGFSAFGMAAHTEEMQIALWQEAISHGFNTARVCADAPTDDWVSARDLRQTKAALDIASRIPNAQVLLVVNCVLRDSFPVPDQLAWDLNVRTLVAAEGYKNVAIEVVNEFWHPDSLLGKRPIVDMVNEWQRVGYDAGADDHICLGDFTLQHRLFGTASFYSFHPCRDVHGSPWDPNVAFLEAIKATNADGRPIVISESVGYDDGSTSCEGLRTCDRERIQHYLNACAAADVGFVYHSQAGLLAYPGYPWWPKAE